MWFAGCSARTNSTVAAWKAGPVLAPARAYLLRVPRGAGLWCVDKKRERGSREGATGAQGLQGAIGPTLAYDLTQSSSTASATSTSNVTYLTSNTLSAGTWAVWASGRYANGMPYEADGTTWTSRTAPAANSWEAVRYGNGTFVAVSDSGTTNNRVMTSTDGITWTLRTGGNAFSWRGVGRERSGRQFRLCMSLQDA